MNVIDENVTEDQKRLLQDRRVRVRQIGSDVGEQGMGDDDVIALLHSLPRNTFFTRDSDFFSQDLRHANYCLVNLAVANNDVAEYVVRFLRHSKFSTQAKRSGVVAQAGYTGIRFWAPGPQDEQHAGWDE